LRIEVLSPAKIHWSTNDWEDSQDTNTSDTGLGVHIADLPSKDLPPHSKIVFTIYWPDQDRWEGTDYSVRIEDQ
jgi:glucoamylase